jgi:antirestriction protein ArdC
MNAAQYQVVTDRIVAMLESGTRPWAKSWTSGGSVVFSPMQRPLRANGQPYKGMNTLNLWAAAQIRGFASPYWFTFKGAKAAGGSVRKGARAELAFFVGQTTVKDADKPDQDDKTISFLKAYHVFNADECEGLPAKYCGDAPVVPAPVVDGRIASVDGFVASLGASIAHGGDRAFYAPSTDSVRMPHLAQFNAPESYYSVLLHELTHWTSHANRCNRMLGARFGDNAYAAEELVAELGAAFLCADLSISAEPREDHASYIASWLSVLKADSKAIFRAAALAEKAATFMHAMQPADSINDNEDEFAIAA